MSDIQDCNWSANQPLSILSVVMIASKFRRTINRNVDGVAGSGGSDGGGGGSSSGGGGSGGGGGGSGYSGAPEKRGSF
ncbi:hypothetical protein M0802_005296 [Mischocyttarus mexicanus]|nr:hypothetical protein M0802_005296 [Mischocyttarus mexicanus]